jgi:hypothetical protein
LGAAMAIMLIGMLALVVLVAALILLAMKAATRLWRGPSI